MGDSVGAIIETPLELGQIFEDWNRKVSAKNAKPGTDTAALFFTISKVGESIDVVEALGNRTADERARFTTDVPLSPETIKSLGKERMLYTVLRASAKAALAWKSVEPSSPLYWDFYDLERDLTAMIVFLDEITFLQLQSAQDELKTRPDECRYFCRRKDQEKYNALISRLPTESPSLAPTTPAPTTVTYSALGTGVCVDNTNSLPYLFWINGHTQTSCQADCSSHGWCQAWHYKNDGQNCGLFVSPDKANNPPSAPNGYSITPGSFTRVTQSNGQSGHECYVKARNYIEYGLLVDEGKGLVAGTGYSLSGCKRWCDDTSGCQSFAYSAKHQQCDLKEKFVQRGEATHTLGEPYEDYKTYYVQRF